MINSNCLTSFLISTDTLVVKYVLKKVLDLKEYELYFLHKHPKKGPYSQFAGSLPGGITKILSLSFLQNVHYFITWNLQISSFEWLQFVTANHFPVHLSLEIMYLGFYLPLFQLQILCYSCICFFKLI